MSDIISLRTDIWAHDVLANEADVLVDEPLLAKRVGAWLERASKYCRGSGDITVGQADGKHCVVYHRTMSELTSSQLCWVGEHILGSKLDLNLDIREDGSEVYVMFFQKVAVLKTLSRYKAWLKKCDAVISAAWGP